MRRPLFWGGLTYLAAMVVVFYFDLRLALVGLAALALATVYCLLFVDRTRALRCGALCLCFLCGMAVFGLSYYCKVTGLSMLEDETVPVRGVVMSQRATGSVEIHTLRLLDLGGENPHGTELELLTFGEVEFGPGDIVEVDAKISLTAYDPVWGKLSLARGTYFSGYARGEVSKLDEPGHRFVRTLAVYRERIKESFGRMLPLEEANLLTAMLLGDRNGITGSRQDAMARSGLAHVIAISGLHLSIMTGLVMRLLKKTPLPLTARYVAVIASAWFMAFFTGLGYPAVRVSVMVTVFYVGCILGRRGDSLNSLGLAAAIIATWEPMSVGSLSFQATFLACVGIVLCAAPIENYLKKKAKTHISNVAPHIGWAISIVAVTVSAQIFTAPLFYCIYGIISVSSLLANVIILPLVPFILSFGYLAGALSLLGPLQGVAGVLMVPARIGLVIMITVSEFFSALPLTLYINDRFIYLWLAGFILLIVWLVSQKAPGIYLELASALGVFVLLLALFTNTLITRNQLRVVAPAGQDGLLLIRGNHAVVVGTFDREAEYRDSLRRYGVREVDLILLTDTGFTANNALATTVSTWTPHSILLPEGTLARSYFSGLTEARIIPAQPMDIQVLVDVNIHLVPGKYLRVEMGDTILFRALDGCDIIDETGEEVAFLPGSETLALRASSTGYRYLQTPIFGTQEIKVKM